MEINEICNDNLLREINLICLHSIAWDIKFASDANKERLPSVLEEWWQRGSVEEFNYFSFNGSRSYLPAEEIV